MLPMLEVLIGVFFVFAVSSLTCSAAAELLERWVQRRATNLEEGIDALIGDPKVANALREHPLISSLAKRAGKFPTHIPSRTFAIALLDSVAHGADDAKAQPEDPLKTLEEPVDRLLENLDTSSPLRRSLASVVAIAKGRVKDGAKGEVEQVAANSPVVLRAVEKWFDDGMDQVTAWYKRYSQVVLFGLGFLLAAGMNLDAIAITKALSTDSTKRAALIAQAEVYAKAEVPPDKIQAQLQGQLDGIGFPIGWTWSAAQDLGWTGWLKKLGGILLTALATSLGASFWFDLLKRVMLVRAGLNPDEDSRQQRSKQKTD